MADTSFTHILSKVEERLFFSQDTAKLILGQGHRSSPRSEFQSFMRMHQRYYKQFVEAKTELLSPSPLKSQAISSLLDIIYLQNSKNEEIFCEALKLTDIRIKDKSRELKSAIKEAEEAGPTLYKHCGKEVDDLHRQTGILKEGRDKIKALESQHVYEPSELTELELELQDAGVGNMYPELLEERIDMKDTNGTRDLEIDQGSVLQRQKSVTLKKFWEDGGRI